MKEKKDKRISTRLSEKDYEALKELITAKGFKTESEAVRYCIKETLVDAGADNNGKVR